MAKKRVLQKEELQKENTKPKFTKEQILKCKKLYDYKDILKVVLKDGEVYTIDEARKKIEEFKERKVR
ncbi:hypothetical protein GND95_08665 [Defluviitalea raffinosedens]|uniref:Uncharacterized protein n=1 Tax=Defluviitalea raffinosedens TaxID=1450156 RepID=A0A7C8HE87_9FIRM|nr:hypothetical protein [Defluviitalea raffinosedens]KAE9633718.1 hypothetical protein GND95_08665 [Defluviitalea raffinosedens]